MLWSSVAIKFDTDIRFFEPDIFSIDCGCTEPYCFMAAISRLLASVWAWFDDCFCERSRCFVERVLFMRELYCEPCRF